MRRGVWNVLDWEENAATPQSATVPISESILRMVKEPILKKKDEDEEEEEVKK